MANWATKARLGQTDEGLRLQLPTETSINRAPETEGRSHPTRQGRPTMGPLNNRTTP